MRGATKIVDEQEALKWIKQGRTYKWMCETYREKYNIETTPSMWSNFRRRRGIDRRVVWDDQLIPWSIKLEHRYSYAIQMLRKEARRRAGTEISPETEHEVDTWIAGMTRDGTVVHYEPETDQGWFYVPRRPGVDKDLIREPERRVGAQRRRATAGRRASA